MRLQQPVRIVASAPAELYKGSCCPAAPGDFPCNFHSESAGGGGKWGVRHPLTPRSCGARKGRTPPTHSREEQNRPPLRRVPIQAGWLPRVCGGPGPGGPGQVQRYVLASRSFPAEPWGVRCRQLPQWRSRGHLGAEQRACAPHPRPLRPPACPSPFQTPAPAAPLPRGLPSPGRGTKRQSCCLGAAPARIHSRWFRRMVVRRPWTDPTEPRQSRDILRFLPLIRRFSFLYGSPGDGDVYMSVFSGGCLHREHP